jgi:endo-1,4-beta-xylanase
MRYNTSRRQVIAGMLGGAVAASLGLPRPAQAAAGPSLKTLAASKGILFGSSVGAGQAGSLTGSFADPAYVDILKAECAVIVPENELKVYVIGAERDQYNFEPGDRLASFAKDNGIKLRGHTLFWNRFEYAPKWLLEQFGTMSVKADEQFLRDYIERVCTHYGDRIYSWDVVNETIDPQSGDIRTTPFTEELGFDGVRVAFEAAREFAPNAQLVYNDYMSWEADHEKHRTGVLKLLERCRATQVPVNALGIQAHIGTDDDVDAAQRKQWQAFVDEVVGMGYQLLITEFDVNDKVVRGDIEQRDAEVAAIAKDYLDLMLSYRQLDQVLCWGMVDKYSWLQGTTPRADNAPKRPTPYDEKYRAKPLRKAIAAAFEAAPNRAARS